MIFVLTILIRTEEQKAMNVMKIEKSLHLLDAAISVGNGSHVQFGEVSLLG